MTLYLTNTLTRKKEPFNSRVEKRVKMFTCGPSIYRRPHVGNFATFLFEDILQRYLEYSGYEIQRVINFTDVEDKALEEAAQKDLSLSALTEPVANQFLKEAASLQMRLPREIPRSSTHVDEAVRLIQELLKGGYAYWHQNDVFYDPLKFKGFGKLYGLDMSRWPKKKRHFRKDTYPGQRWNLGDFILWHGYRPQQDDRFYWDTPIGKGRPAWNIQDPAIISSKLGYQIDIACGGVDNLYRHHDYTIAVMEAVSQRLFSRYWLHGEHVLLNGRKMSKSKGNILYLEDIQDKGFTAKDIRFYLIYGHYRKKINLTFKQLQRTADQLTSLRDTVRNVCHTSGPGGRRAQNTGELIHGLTRTFEDRMNDDLGVRGAFDNIASILGKLNALHNGHGLSKNDRTQILHALERIDSVFGILF
jgi:cysteinyl-tRNA synthetase